MFAEFPPSYIETLQEGLSLLRHQEAKNPGEMLQMIRVSYPQSEVLHPIPGHEGWFKFDQKLLDVIPTCDWKAYYGMGHAALTGEWRSDEPQVPAISFPRAQEVGDLIKNPQMLENRAVNPEPLLQSLAPTSTAVRDGGGRAALDFLPVKAKPDTTPIPRTRTPPGRPMEANKPKMQAITVGTQGWATSVSQPPPPPKAMPPDVQASPASTSSQGEAARSIVGSASMQQPPPPPAKATFGLPPPSPTSTLGSQGGRLAPPTPQAAPIVLSPCTPPTSLPNEDEVRMTCLLYTSDAADEW